MKCNCSARYGKKLVSFIIYLLSLMFLFFLHNYLLYSFIIWWHHLLLVLVCLTKIFYSSKSFSMQKIKTFYYCGMHTETDEKLLYYDLFNLYFFVLFGHLPNLIIQITSAGLYPYQVSITTKLQSKLKKNISLCEKFSHVIILSARDYWSIVYAILCVNMRLKVNLGLINLTFY